MQRRTILAAGADLADRLTGADLITLIQKDFSEKSIGAEHGFGMLDDDKSAISGKSTAAIDDLPALRGAHGLAETGTDPMPLRPGPSAS